MTSSLVTSPLVSSTLTGLRRYAAERTDIEAVILFGSVARGEAGPESDLDVGILLTREANEAGVDVLRLISDLTRLFERSDIDVTILNRATPVLLHRVARDGHVLYATSNRAVAEFHLRAIQRYEDTRPLRTLQFQRLLQEAGGLMAPAEDPR